MDPNWSENEDPNYTIRAVASGPVTFSGDAGDEEGNCALLQTCDEDTGSSDSGDSGNSDASDSGSSDSSDSGSSDSSDSGSSDSSDSGSSDNSDSGNSDSGTSDNGNDDTSSGLTEVQEALLRDLRDYQEGLGCRGYYNLYAFDLYIDYVYASDSVYSNCYNAMSEARGRGTSYDHGQLWFYVPGAEFVVGDGPQCEWITDEYIYCDFPLYDDATSLSIGMTVPGCFGCCYSYYSSSCGCGCCCG